MEYNNDNIGSSKMRQSEKVTYEYGNENRLVLTMLLIQYSIRAYDKYS